MCEVLEEEICLKTDALLCVVTGEEENEEEENGLFVSAALSKIHAGVALLVRETGVTILCFYSERRDIYVYLSAVFASRVFSRFRNRTHPLNIK